MVDSEQADSKSNSDESKVGDEAEIELSLEDLDKVISEADPEFASSIQEVAKEAFSNEVLDDSAFEYTFELEKKSWEQKNGAWGKVYKFFPFIALFSFLFLKFKTQAVINIQKFKISLITFLKAIGPWTKIRLQKFGKMLKSVIAALGTQFGKQTKLGKLWFVGVILFAIGSGVVSFIILSKGLLPAPKSLFMASLNEWAEEEFTFNPNEEMESFYDSTKSVQNVFSLNRIVVNIKKSMSSGDNPMAAFEFVLEGTSSDSVIEVKDREAEVRDLFQRVIEDMNFDQLSSVEGKHQLSESLLKAANKVLTQGKLRRIYIKTAIVKP